MNEAEENTSLKKTDSSWLKTLKIPPLKCFTAKKLCHSRGNSWGTAIKVYSLVYIYSLVLSLVVSIYSLIHTLALMADWILSSKQPAILTLLNRQNLSLGVHVLWTAWCMHN